MDQPPRRPARPPRWIPALAASVVLHALVAAALWTWRPDAAPGPPRSAPIEFVLVQLPPLPRQGEPKERPQARSAGSAVPDVESSVPDVESSVPSSVADVEGVAPGAVPDVSRADHPDLAWAVPGPPATASPPDLTGRPPDAVVAYYAQPDASPEVRLQRLLREDVGRAKVQSGLADPFFLDLGRSILQAWDPERVVTDRGLPGYLSQLGRSLVDYAAVYVDQAARFGRTGSPFAPGEVPLSLAGLAAVPEGLSTQISDGMTVARALADQVRTRHAALVRVVQRADGRLVSVELLRSSDDSSVDAQALRDLHEAAAHLPAPTPSALAGRTVVASIWEFSLVVSITPPLPMIAVQFDEVLGLLDARVPLDRRLFKLVRLVSVE